MKIRVLAAAIITSLLLSSCGSTGGGGRFNIVASFYPMYVTLLNLTEGCDGVTVTNLTDTNVGCLHDYTLTTGDLKKLSSCDMLVINGAGMEPFMDKIKENSKSLYIVDASRNVKMIEEHGETNPHVWLSFPELFSQIKTVKDELCKRDPQNAAVYEENMRAYTDKLNVLMIEAHEKLDGFKGQKIVTFHEAFDYLARDYGIDIAATIVRDEHSAPTPAEIASAIELIKKDGIRGLFTEPNSTDGATATIATATGRKVYTLDPVVTPAEGVADKDAYIVAMGKNIEAVAAA
ncbi:MAG: metal ABC transporter substrate-binding protein, partial [Clostridia bacterium]